MAFFIVALEAPERDAQHDFAGARGPAHALFCRLKPLQEAAAAEHDIAETRAQIRQRVLNTGARASGPPRPSVGVNPAWAPAVRKRSQFCVVRGPI